MPMQMILNNLNYIIGNQHIADQIDSQPSLLPFSDDVIIFLNDLSSAILSDKEASAYPDVITFAFWCRKASVEVMKKNYFNSIGNNENSLCKSENIIRYGRGCVFHIAPSNVAVNYAYSLVVGMLAGNTNIVRLPSKDFPQVNLINKGLRSAIERNSKFASRICIVKYGHEKEITDYFSIKCDTRVIWGGDNTIFEIRKSPLKPRGNEITFADRYSISVIDSDKYLSMDKKEKIATDFFNDTYLTDQNACTSPRIVIWLGEEETSRVAQGVFWGQLIPLLEGQYSIQPVQAISKLASLYKLGVNYSTARVNNEIKINNKLVRVQIKELSEDLMGYRNNSGFFMEYYASTLDEIEPLCVSECQTLSYLGINKEDINQFLMNFKPKGIDRVVPFGKTMDFHLIWDGYDLINQLTRNITF